MSGGLDDVWARLRLMKAAVELLATDYLDPIAVDYPATVKRAHEALALAARDMTRVIDRSPRQPAGWTDDPK